MKNRKILYALGVIIALLIVYAIVSVRDRAADLPSLNTWSESADEITITKGDKAIRLHRRDGRWLIGEAGFPADGKTMDAMEAKLRDLAITDITSKKPHYERFDLTPESALRVTAKRGGSVLRDIYIGRKSDKTTHTFIRLVERPEVFKVSGTLSYDFNKKLDELRDKVVFDIKRDDIDSIDILYKGRTTSLTRVKTQPPQEPAKAVDPKAKGKAPAPPKQPDKWIFAGRPEKNADVNAVNAVIDSFSPLRVKSYPDMEKAVLVAPLCSVKITALGKTHELSIYRGKDKETFLCTSSAMPYVFDLAKYSAERYFREAKDFEQ